MWIAARPTSWRRATPATSAARSFRPTASGSRIRKQDKLLRSHVWVKELASGQEHMIGGDEFLHSSGAQVDARRQEAAADRRCRRAGDGRVESHRDAALRGRAAAGGEGPERNEINSEEQAMAVSAEAAGRGGRGAAGAGSIRR